MNSWTEPKSGNEYVFAFGGKTSLHRGDDGTKFIERYVYVIIRAFQMFGKRLCGNCNRYNVRNDNWERLGHLEENTWGRVANLRVGNRIFLDSPGRYLYICLG